jgi:hypothetical protein
LSSSDNHIARLFSLYQLSIHLGRIPGALG